MLPIFIIFICRHVLQNVIQICAFYFIRIVWNLIKICRIDSFAIFLILSRFGNFVYSWFLKCYRNLSIWRIRTLSEFCGFINFVHSNLFWCCQGLSIWLIRKFYKVIKVCQFNSFLICRILLRFVNSIHSHFSNFVKVCRSNLFVICQNFVKIC